MKEGREGRTNRSKNMIKKKRKCILCYMQHEISFQSFQEMSGTSELTFIFNTGTLLICSKVQFYNLVSDQPRISGTL